MSISGEYKGYTIEWSDYKKLTVLLEDAECRSGFMSEADATNYINGLLKKEWEPLDAYVNSYWGFEPVVITSKDSDEQSVWVKNAKGKRSKERICTMFARSEHNNAIYAELQSIDKAHEKLKAQKEAAYKRLIPLNGNDIKEVK